MSDGEPRIKAVRKTSPRAALTPSPGDNRTSIQTTDASAAGAVCVAHLVREKNGPQPFREFMESYREHDAGVNHDLLLIFKGFDAPLISEPYAELLHGVAFTPVFVPDRGFDIGPYFAVTMAFDYRYFCFLNSFSLILAHRWLGTMHDYVRQQDIGLVGATGSWESIYSTQLWRLRNRRRPYTPRRLSGTALMHLQAQTTCGERFFAPFPNPHLRTNAFMISRDVMQRLAVGRIRSKLDACRFESGRQGMTRQVLALGLQPVVVGRDGKGYGIGQWPESCTFRSGEQVNLLVTDKQTRYYARQDAMTKHALSDCTWGLDSVSLPNR